MMKMPNKSGLFGIVLAPLNAISLNISRRLAVTLVKYRPKNRKV